MNAELKIKATAMLGEGGFVFLDDLPRPYLVRKNGEDWWLYYWNEGTRQFVTLRPLNFGELSHFYLRALSEDLAALYFAK